MKDSKQVRSEYQSFVDAYGKIAEASVPEPEKERLKNTKSNPAGEPQTPLGGDRRPMVKCRKEGAFTEQAEKYQMSVKQFARFVEANQLLFSVDTRKKAQVANAFQGFKETAEWDEFFDDTEMVDENFVAQGRLTYGSTPGKATTKSVSGAVDKALANKGTAVSTASEKGKTGVTGSGSISYSGRVKLGGGSKSPKPNKPDKPNKPNPTGGRSKPTPTSTVSRPKPTPTSRPTGGRSSSGASSTGRPGTLMKMSHEPEGQLVDEGAVEFLRKSNNPIARAARALVSPAKGNGRGTARPSVRVQDRIRKNEAGMESLEWDEKEINDVILEVTTKETKSGTKYKVRVKHKETGSSYIRYATREMIAQMRNDPKISSVEMTDEGDAPEDKGEKKALEKGGGDTQKSDEKQDTKQAAEKGGGFAGKVKKRSVTTEAKKLDPVGKEDGDVDNDGDKDSSDEYLMKRRKAIGKAMKKEGYSNWRQDLTEVIKDEDEVGTVKEKGVKNKVEIMPKMEGYGKKTSKKRGKKPCDECSKEEVAVEGEVTEGSYQGGGALRPTDRIKMGDGSLKSLKDIDAKLKEKNTKKEEVTTEGETLEEGPAALAIKMGLAAGTAIAGTKIGQEAIKKVRGMVQKKREREAPYRKMLGK